MLIPIKRGQLRCRDAVSAGLQGEHALDVPAHGYQIRLTSDVLEPSQQRLAITHTKGTMPITKANRHKFEGLIAKQAQRDWRAAASFAFPTP
jgi:hypothetical protein